MQMQVLSTFSESDGINPIAAGELSNQATGLLDGDAPSIGFIGCEIDGTSTVAQCVEKDPTGQWCWIRVMSQHP